MYSINRYHIFIVISIFIFFAPFLSLASVNNYWQRPILSQNPAFSLYPENCGACHKAQYDVWKDSLHSKAMSPGLMGQLNPKDDPEFAASCYFCHAPLSEQSEVIPPNPPLEKGGEGGFEQRFRIIRREATCLQQKDR